MPPPSPSRPPGSPPIPPPSPAAPLPPASPARPPGVAPAAPAAPPARAARTPAFEFDRPSSPARAARTLGGVFASGLASKVRVAPTRPATAEYSAPLPPVPVFASPPRPRQPPPRSPEEAAVRLQRWYRNNARRRRFLTVVNRARRRRRYLDERRRVAQRVYAGEADVEEMKARLALPGGYKLVSRWKDGREAEAATRVQNLWRSMRAKKQLVQLVGQQVREEAARRLQAFARRNRRKQRQSLLARSAAENPCWRPVDTDRLSRHAEEIISKRRQHHASMCRGFNEVELRKQAEARYRELTDGVGRWRYDVWRSLLQREQTKEMIQALEGRSWDRPSPYSVCSATLLKDAEEKHRERKAAYRQDRQVGAESGGVWDSGTPVAVESRAEELEADTLLHSLEADLGYDFSFSGDR
ncbi:unnamed protein product [Polarella glacialis]|uniref:Uncharacterized protein n=1 Tax=Polarella glacialis TaxID=89957 RepID=A0A813J2Z1_POLGL|nr:unnamed protein product [Polarella glacialis]